MAQVTDRNVRDALEPVVQAAFGADTRVVKRWKLAFQADDWKSALRAVSTVGKTNGWIYARTEIKTESAGMPVHRYDKFWTYRLWYFRSIEEGTSEYEINEKLDSLIDALEDTPSLGLEPDTGFNGHLGLQVTNIDTIDDQFHFITASLTVMVTRTF